jgi:hypothetical protein
MQNNEFSAAVERLNAGAEVPTVDASLLEHMWQAISRISKELREQGHTAISLAASALGVPGRLPQTPEQKLALGTRYALLDALIERGILDDYMADELLRKKVFAAAAAFPFDKNDLVDALAQRLLHKYSPDAAQKANEEFRQAGYDPDHPKVAEKLIRWMNDNSS